MKRKRAQAAMASVEVLATEVAGLRELIGLRFDTIDEKLGSLATAAQVEQLEVRVADIEDWREEHDGLQRPKFERVERIVWVIVGVFTVFGIPALLWVMYQLLEALASALS